MMSHKHEIAILVLIFVALTSFGQKMKPTYLLAFCDSSSGNEIWGFKTASGQIAIKPKYEMVLGTDTLYNIAFVTLNYNWVVINKQDSIILTPYIFDNGPDYIEEGFFRFVENNKIGFANSKGQKINPELYDFAFPFSDGFAAFSIGGKMEKWDEEHSTWNGGIWGFINKKGQVVIKPQFTNAYNFNKGHCEVWTKDNKHVLINKKGLIVNVLTN